MTARTTPPSSARFCAAKSVQQRYEDDDVLAFHDIHPVADVHFLIILNSSFLAGRSHGRRRTAPGKMLALAPVLAKEQGLTDGFRTAINTGRMGRQDVYHLHIHIFGNKPGAETLKVMHGH